MFTAIASFFGGLFSSSKLQDTAIDGLRKIGGLDELNGKDKAEFILAYIAASKHQSPTRRFIAIMMSIGFAVFAAVWLISTVSMYLYLFFGGSPVNAESLNLLRGDIFTMCKEILLQPVNIIISFYFIVDAAKKR